jgi:hypothetical protein
MSRISDAMRQRSIEMAATAPSKPGRPIAVAYDGQHDHEGNTGMWAVYSRTEDTLKVWYLGHVTREGRHVRLGTIDTGTIELAANNFGLIVDVTADVWVRIGTQWHQGSVVGAVVDHRGWQARVDVPGLARPQLFHLDDISGVDPNGSAQ